MHLRAAGQAEPQGHRTFAVLSHLSQEPHGAMRLLPAAAATWQGAAERGTSSAWPPRAGRESWLQTEGCQTRALTTRQVAKRAGCPPAATSTGNKHPFAHQEVPSHTTLTGHQHHEVAQVVQSAAGHTRYAAQQERRYKLINLQEIPMQTAMQVCAASWFRCAPCSFLCAIMRRCVWRLASKLSV